MITVVRCNPEMNQPKKEMILKNPWRK